MTRPSSGPSTHDGVRGSMVPIAAAVLARPRLWLAALAALDRIARPRWWRRRPHLPVPDDRLWAFRMETVYGRSDAEPCVEDVVAYLDWSRRDARRLAARRRGGRNGPVGRVGPG